MRQNVEINGLGPDPVPLEQNIGVTLEENGPTDKPTVKKPRLGKVRVNEGDAW
jgi:hypothetical protein